MWLNGNAITAASIYLLLGLRSVEMAEEGTKHDSLMTIEISFRSLLKHHLFSESFLVILLKITQTLLTAPSCLIFSLSIHH